MNSKGRRNEVLDDWMPVFGVSVSNPLEEAKERLRRKRRKQRQREGGGDRLELKIPENIDRWSNDANISSDPDIASLGLIEEKMEEAILRMAAKKKKVAKGKEEEEEEEKEKEVPHGHLRFMATHKPLTSGSSTSKNNSQLREEDDENSLDKKEKVEEPAPMDTKNPLKSEN